MSCATDSYRHHLTLPLSRKERGGGILSAVVHGRRDPRGEGFSQPLKTKMPRSFLTQGIGKYIRHRPDFMPPTCLFLPEGGTPIFGNKKDPMLSHRVFKKYIRHRPTLPYSYPYSTIGSAGLNYSVRNGKRCNTRDIDT